MWTCNRHLRDGSRENLRICHDLRGPLALGKGDLWSWFSPWVLQIQIPRVLATKRPTPPRGLLHERQPPRRLARAAAKIKISTAPFLIVSQPGVLQIWFSNRSGLVPHCVYTHGPAVLQLRPCKSQWNGCATVLMGQLGECLWFLICARGSSAFGACSSGVCNCGVHVGSLWPRMRSSFYSALQHRVLTTIQYVYVTCWMWKALRTDFRRKTTWKTDCMHAICNMLQIC